MNRVKRNAIAATVLLALLAAAGGCGRNGEAKKTDSKTGGKPPVPVDAVAPAVADVTDGIDVVGTLSPKYAADMKSEYGGIIAQVYVSEWARVKKGQPLARVDTREGDSILRKSQAAHEMAKATLAESQAAATRAERELERALLLKESGLLTQQALDDARTQKEASAARVAAARAQVDASGDEVAQVKTRLSKAVIAAPFDGIVQERQVNVGDLVGEMQKVIFRVVDNRLLDLTATVPSAGIGSVRVGQTITFSTEAVPGREFTGRVTFINPAVSPADRSLRVVAQVANVPEILRGGLFVKGRIVTGIRKGVLKIPRAALLSWDVAGRSAQVYVVDNAVARLRTVRTGAASGESVEIAAGIARADRVVTRGGFNLKDGDAVKVAPAEAK